MKKEKGLLKLKSIQEPQKIVEVNVYNIEYFRPERTGKGTIIYLNNKTSLCVKESFEEVQKKFDKTVSCL